LLTLLLAGLLPICATLFALRTWLACRALAAVRSVETDPLEQRLAEKELRLKLGLGRRSTLALGRASLFGGTGFGVWTLSGGSTHYLDAGVAFGFGVVGWAGCGEFQRRLGSLADSRRRQLSSSARQGVDQPQRTG